MISNLPQGVFLLSKDKKTLCKDGISQESITEGCRLSTVDLLVQTFFRSARFYVENTIFLFYKTKYLKSTVLSLPLQLVFPEFPNTLSL